MSLIAPGVVLRHAQDQLAVNGQGLDNDVKAFPVRVGKGRADIDPEIISALTLYDNVGAVRGLRIRRHGSPPSMTGDGIADERERFLERGHALRTKVHVLELAVAFAHARKDCDGQASIKERHQFNGIELDGIM